MLPIEYFFFTTKSTKKMKWENARDYPDHENVSKFKDTKQRIGKHLINIQNRSVRKEKSVIMSVSTELGSKSDESLAFPKSEYEQLKGKANSRKFYINHRQFPQLTIYLFALYVVCKNEKQEITNVTRHFEEPSVGYTITFPEIDNHTEISDDTRKELTDVEESYLLNRLAAEQEDGVEPRSYFEDSEDDE